jgi:hypothetical protein
MPVVFRGSRSLRRRPSPAAEPPTLGRYAAWLADPHGITNLESHRNHYEAVCKSLLTFFNASPFWRRVVDTVRNIDVEYNISTKFPLIVTFDPPILVKPWPSFLEKSYRKNIVQNTAFPNPPPEGWCIPPVWYSQIHDIVRTTIIVKYIDGVPLVLGTLRDIADTLGIRYDANLETRPDGYYGAHFNLKMPCEIYTMDFATETRVIEFEIQITTQIKDVIKQLLHTYYETHRVNGKNRTLSDIAWKYSEDEFVATYLGHILHYVEGMIIAVRDKRRAQDA